MTTMKCAVYDEGLDAPCVMRATMVRTLFREGEFPTCVYFCKEHGIAHEAVVIDLALKVRHLRERALKGKEEHLVNACDKALIGDELAIDECVEAMDAR